MYAQRARDFRLARPGPGKGEYQYQHLGPGTIVRRHPIWLDQADLVTYERWTRLSEEAHVLRKRIVRCPLALVWPTVGKLSRHVCPFGVPPLVQNPLRRSHGTAPPWLCRTVPGELYAAKKGCD